MELSAITVAFISCRSTLTKLLVGAARGEKESKGEGGQVSYRILRGVLG